MILPFLVAAHCFATIALRSKFGAARQFFDRTQIGIKHPCTVWVFALTERVFRRRLLGEAASRERRRSTCTQPGVTYVDWIGGLGS